MALLAVDDALAAILKDANSLPGENVPLAEAAFRVLSQDLQALRTQPPFSASAMDGYAVRHIDLADIPVMLNIVGEAGAGHPFDGEITEGECIRIFTGAPVPDSADTIIIQENTEKPDDGSKRINILQAAPKGSYIRNKGLDFTNGETLLKAGSMLDPTSLSLAAAMNHASVPVIRKPKVAIIATGDELLLPGSTVGPGQIIASNTYGVTALVQSAGGIALDLGIVRDTIEAHAAAFNIAIQLDADVLVTLGGASVGEHDLVQKVLLDMGAEIDFWRIAMRPGKPLMFGTLPHKAGSMRFLGLPGNPVSSLVCSHLFLQPLIATLAERTHANLVETCILGQSLPGNDRRQDYLRAAISINADGQEVATAFEHQDSSMLSLMAQSDCLIIRPPFAKAAYEGDECEIVRL
jgi:molybdopterin molybdotransferase